MDNARLRSKNIKNTHRKKTRQIQPCRCQNADYLVLVKAPANWLNSIVQVTRNTALEKLKFTSQLSCHHN